MKPLKLFMDSGEQPDNTYLYGKNGIQFDVHGTILNEPGFKAMQAALPYPLIGLIETDNKVVVLSCNNTDSAVGYFNPSTELYEPIVDDNPSNLVNWPTNGERLGFTMDHYITGEAQRNYKGEVVIAFTDKDKFPKYLNCDNPQITRLDDLRLFPFYSQPTIKLSDSIGGSLSAGTYYIAVGYERNDGTSTPYCDPSDGLTITPSAGGTNSTDKAILITISNADTSYQFMRVAVISKVNGKTSAIELTDWVPVTSSSIDVLYTGDNLSSDIAVEQILTPPSVYERVGTIGQLNDSLYIGDLETEVELVKGLQKYVNMARIRWNSTLMDATAPTEDHLTGKVKSWMHEETYAFYIRFHKTRGGFTKAFILPALPVLPAFDVYSSEGFWAGASDFTNIPKTKVEDCIPFFDAVSKSGYCGTFRNNVETYPDDPEFDSTSIGGPNLRNQPVRHHKMPSLRWCKNNLYSSVPDYGKRSLDLLSMTVENLNLPADYTNLIDGYELLYAKRTPSNQTIYGQGAMLHVAVSVPQTNTPTANANLYTTGGNFASNILHKGKGDYNDDWDLPQLRLDTFRIHPFDILLNKPTIEPTFLSGQFKLRKARIRTEGYLEDGAQDGDHNMPIVLLIDYAGGADNPASIAVGKQLKYIKKSFYLAQGVTVNNFNNARHEPCFAGITNAISNFNWPVSYQTSSYRIRGTSFTEAGAQPDFEETYIVNMLALKADIYSSFYSQTLVSAGSYRLMGDLTPFVGGDTFNCMYTFHTYGRHDQVDTQGEGFKGKKVIRRIICESASNINQRYEIPGNEYSRFWDRTAVAANNPDQCYITKFDRSIDPNQFGYSKDLNALNDFISSTIFNPFSETITKFPYRVHRGGKLSKQTRPRSWRTFLPLDYYECQKNMGKIINISGMYDRLIIHHENAMFVTRDKVNLNAGLLSITLGSGDIFQFEPAETQPSKLGYAGTIHDLACVKTPIGYFFVDARQGEVYLWNGSAPKLLNLDINIFLREFLKIEEKNIYTGNGITLGYDQKYKRLLLTVKNEKPAPQIQVKPFQDTDEFYNNLVEGDIINYNGRYLVYKGLNDQEQTGLECSPDPQPPDQFEWIADQVICETDEPVANLPTPTPEEFENLSSPAFMVWYGPSGRMYVADYDQAAGNFYRIDLESGIKVYFGTPDTLYSFVVDKDNSRIFGAGLTGGLKVFNIDDETMGVDPVDDTTPYITYGTNAALSRVGLWKIGMNIIGKDLSTGTLTFIDRSNLGLVATKNMATDIPSGTTYLVGKFDLLDVDGNAWVIPDTSANGVIAIYSGDFSTLIGTFTVPGMVPVEDWGGNNYIATGFVDQVYGKVYIHDVGSNSTYVYNKTDHTLIKTYTWVKAPDVTNIRMRFVVDPVNNDLYFCYDGVDVDGSTLLDSRVYVVDRTTGDFVKVYINKTIEGELERQGATEFMWTALPGKRSWEGGAWATDGEIQQYTHGEEP